MCEKHRNAHTHTGPLFIFANGQQKQIGQAPHLKHEHFSKEVGAEEKSRNVFQYILTSGHEGTHSIPTEQMGALVTRSVAPNLASLVRGQISADHTERGNLGQFCASSAPCEWLQGSRAPGTQWPILHVR